MRERLWIPLSLLGFCVFMGSFPSSYIYELEPTAPTFSKTHAARSRFSLGLDVAPKSVTALKQVYDRHDFDLERVRHQKEAVPRIFLANLPFDLRKYSHLGEKKALFIKMMLPLILKKNESILESRTKLEQIQKKKAKGVALSSSEHQWLHHLAADYKVPAHDLKNLLKRVDIVPASLAIAQAVKESGWGSSTAALGKHSPFGHMATKKKVKRFDSLDASVVAYIDNINKNPAYKKLHDRREKLRAAGKAVAGSHLAGGLTKYSERGVRYVREIEGLIKKHKLEHFDSVSFVNKGYDDFSTPTYR